MQHRDITNYILSADEKERLAKFFLLLMDMDAGIRRKQKTLIKDLCRTLRNHIMRCS